MPRVRLAWLLAFGAVTQAHATPRRAPPPAVLEDPCSDAACTHHALDGFRAALAAQRAGTEGHPLRISYFGDSLTADDQITDELRRELQTELGDGGPGFVFAIAPHPYCQHRAVNRIVGDGWQVWGVSTTVPPDHLLGLGGSAEGDGAIRFVPTSKTVRSVDVDYLAQPHGGTLEVLADKTVVATIATAAERKQAAFATAAIPEGTKRIELRASGRVRLFGATLEAPSGAVVDNLGVINATAKQMRNNIASDHLRDQLAHRATDLAVIMLGTNEAEWLRARGAGMEEHEKLFTELLATIRASSPHGSCLVVSPLDQIDWRDDKMPARTSVPAMVEAQRRAAVANGCAFWDVYTWMGGKGSAAAWHTHGWIAKDYQHPTSEGAERIAGALYDALVAPR